MDDDVFPVAYRWKSGMTVVILCPDQSIVWTPASCRWRLRGFGSGFLEQVRKIPVGGKVFGGVIQRISLEEVADSGL